MELKKLVKILDLQPLLPAVEFYGDGSEDDGVGAVVDTEITRGYASDLLSDVLANAPSGGVLVTLQVHLNVIAVASHAGLQAVIFSCGRVPDEEVVDKAAEEGLLLFVSAADTFEVAGRLYELGLRGSSA
jgi:hypothetical protein